MIAATLAGALGLMAIDEQGAHALTLIWLVTGGWITIRATLGFLRVWPGLGGPLGVRGGDAS